VSFEPRLLEQLKRARLHDAVGKLRAHQVVGEIKHRLAEHGPVAELSPEDPAFRQFCPPGTRSKGPGWSVLRIRGRLVGLEATFSHAKPANTGMVELANGDWLGWQYQEGQWRLAVVTAQHNERTEDSRARRHRYVADSYDQSQTWFDFGPLGVALGHPVQPESPRGTNRYHRFDPNFAYRYCRVDTDKTGLTLGKVVDLGVQYLELALAW
jgi:hypothetical protein